MTLGGRIVSAREAAGYTSEQLAQRIGVMQETLDNWEADRDEPRGNKLVTLAGVLGVSVLWLGLGEESGAEFNESHPIEETRALKVKMETLLALHEQTSKLIFEIQADLQRLQARIDAGEMEVAGNDALYEDA